MTTSAYLKVGRLPTPSHGEDRALCSLVRRKGLRVVSMDAGSTVSSARLWGRASGGCGAALRRRMAQDDPLCDDLLIPVADLEKAAGVWNKLESGRARYRQFDAYRNAEGLFGRTAMSYTQVLSELSLANRILADQSDQPMSA